MNNSINKSHTSFTSNSIAVGKATLLTEETRTNFKLACMEDSPAVEVQLPTGYISWINWKSCHAS